MTYRELLNELEDAAGGDFPNKGTETDDISTIGNYEVHPSAADEMTYCVVHNGRVRNEGLSKPAAVQLARELDYQERLKSS